MIDQKKVLEGLKCCQISMKDERPFEKCDRCPYNGVDIIVEECRSKLCADCQELIESLNIQLDEAMLWR